MNRGDDFRRFEVVDVLSDLPTTDRGFQRMYVPPVEVFDDSDDSHLARLVDEDVVVESFFDPFKVVDGHMLQSIERRTCK